MDRAYAAGVLVVVIQQDMPPGAPAFAVNSDGWALHPEIAGRPHHHLLHKRLPGAFTDTDLGRWLGEHDVDTVTIVGYMTQHCVDSTARQAMHAGFRVEVLSDATGTLGYANEAGRVEAPQMHQAPLVALQAGIAAVGTTTDWLAALDRGDTLPLNNPISSAASAARQ
jgi:nicotinamidase-related amidase